MKTRHFLIGMLLFTSMGLFAQKGVVNKGAKIIITNNAILNIDGGMNANYTNKSYDASSHGKIDLQGKIKLEGDWQNLATSGNVFINTATDGEIVFDGTTQQVIGGTASTYFEKFTLNNAIGVRLNAETSIKGTLTLTSGLLKIGTNNLLLDASTTIAGSPSASAMIVANNTGSVFKYITSSGSFTFPVGDTLGVTEYSPFTLTFNSGTFGSGAYVKLNITNAKHPNNSSNAAYLNRFWSVATSNISSINADVTAKYADGDIFGTESAIYMAKYNSPYWDKYNVVNTGSNLLTANITGFSDFTGAESAAVTPAITLSGSMNEGNEDGQVITITLTNDDFAPSLNTNNWNVTNLPQGVTKGTLTRTGNNTATLALSGNRTKDFDGNITNITISVAAAELVHTTMGTVSASNGVVITATDDNESITITDDGLITEGSESGEIITVTAVGGTFVNPLNPANWTLTRLPSGISKGAVTWINPTSVQIALTGVSSDYDSDSLNATLNITASEIDEYTGVDLVVATGVKFTAIDESLSITMASVGTILEESENNKVIKVAITGRIFSDPLAPANWTLTNLPEGVQKGSVSRAFDDTVLITLSGDRIKDYDADITNMSVQIGVGEISSYSSIAYITNGVTFTATNDSESIALSDNGISEGFENGKIITATLTGGTYASSLSLPNWSVTNLPQGVSVGSINRVSSTVAELYLSGNSEKDFDTDITDVTVSAAPGEIDDHTGSSIFTTTGVTIVATNDVEILSMSDDGIIDEGSENGEVITVTLTGGTIVNPINPSNWVLSNLPVGVSANPAIQLSDTTVYFSLAGNSSQDYDTNIVNTTLTVATSELTDTIGTNMEISSGVTFIANDEPVILTLTDDGINEGFESGEVLTVALIQDIFVSVLTESNWILSNLPQGVNKGDITRVSDDTVTIALSGNRTKDYDTDILNTTLTIDGAELIQHNSTPLIQNSGLVFDATDDGELLIMEDDGQILEGYEDGEIITVTIFGGTFGTITPLNWTINGMPSGVSIGSINKTNSDTVLITLMGNSTIDYDLDITNCILSVNEVDIDDYSDINLTASTGVTFTSVIESIDITMEDDGILVESAEDSEVITVKISNDVFVASINASNWAFSSIPEGITIASIARINDTLAEITLSGNRKKDYDSDISSAMLTIVKEEFLNQNTNVVVSSGILFKALDDEESITISDNGNIIEGSEDGKIITATITGGTFANNLISSNWLASNLPAGVTIGSVFKVDQVTAEITLSGNREVDYDTTLSNFTLSINESEIDDYLGGNIDATGTVTLTALVEEMTIVHSGLTESNLNGALIAIELVNESFLDAAFDFNNIVFNNAPAGVSINYIEYLDATHANVFLYYDGTDFDADVTDFSITILENELQGVTELTSNEILISALVENIDVTMFDQGIYEGAENGSIIYVVVKEDIFNTTLTLTNWVLTNLPNGVSIDSLSLVSNDTVAITLSGNRLQDYDDNIYNIQLDIAADEFANSLIPVSVTSGVVFLTTNDFEYIAISDNGINEGAEDGKIIFVKLYGGTFSPTINPANWTISNLPLGVTVDSIVAIDADSIQILLSGNATIDYDSDIDGVKISIAEQEIDDYIGSDLVASSGVVFFAVNDDEFLSMTDNGINEGTEDGRLIEINLTGGTFATNLDILRWNSINLPNGVALGSIDRISSHQAIITLSGNRTVDYDTDITDFNLIVNGNQVNDFTGSNFVLSSGVTFKAYNEMATLVHSGLAEDNLNGALINLNLINETFLDTQLDKNNFNLFGLPFGAKLDSVEFLNGAQANLLVVFDGTDFDSDFNQVYLEIDKSEISSNTNLATDTITITAINDAEILIMTDDGSINEGTEESESIEISLIGGTFTNPLQPSNWTLYNAPMGVTLGSLNRNSNTSVTLVLSGNALQDYDIDITDFTVQIQPDEVSDYQGSAFQISSGVTFISHNEQLAINNPGLTESNLNGAIIELTLSEESFSDMTLINSSFLLNNAPIGLGVISVTYQSITAASMLLGFDGTDFDEDISNLSITINKTELLGINDLTSNSIPITAVIETQTALISHSGLTEENLNGAIVNFDLENEHFSDAVLDVFNFNLVETPMGSSISAVDYISDTVAQITISFDGYDFDNDYVNFRISVHKSEILGTSGVTSNALTISATNDAEVLSMESDGYIEEGTEDGEIITIHITGGTFTLNPISENWEFFNLPTGIQRGNLHRIDNHTISISLYGNATDDYDQDITNVEVQVNESEVDDYAGTPLIINSGLIFTAIVEPETKLLTISDIGLSENSLNGASLTANLTADYLADNSIDIPNIKLLNAPVGLLINSVTIIDSASFIIELAFDGTDFDVDYSNFKIQLLEDELHGAEDLVSNSIAIHAIIEAQQILISNAGLTELNWNNSVLQLAVIGDSFLDNSLAVSNFKLTNAPDTSSIIGVTYINDTAALVTISFDGTDFDADITNLGIVVLGNEFVSGNSILSNDLIIEAINDEEVLSMTDDGLIIEHEIEGEIVTVKVSGGNYVANLNPSNWSLTDAPIGLVIRNVLRVDDFTVLMELGDDGIIDFDTDITNLNLSVAADEINDHQTILLEVSTGITLLATIESASIAHSGLTEENLNGAIVTLTLMNETFVDNMLDASNFILNSSEVQIQLDQVTYVSSISAELTLRYNLQDFDFNQALSISVNKNELLYGEALESNVLQIIATNDEEIFIMNDDGQILEASESGEVITVSLVGGTFIENPEFSSWIFNNLPAGVSVGTIEKVSSQTINILLQGNSTVDYDSNLTQFNVLIAASDFNDYSGSDVIVSGGVTFTAVLENSNLAIEHAGLNELNLDGAVISLTLTDAVFDNAMNGNLSGITLNNVPDGLSVSNYQVENETTAILTLGYLGFDFDTDYSDFSISLDPNMLIPQVLLTSNSLIINASIEPLITVSSDGLIHEGAEDGKVLSINLAEGNFNSTFTIENVSLTNLPAGIAIGDLILISDVSCSIKLIGNRTSDYDVNISSVLCNLNSTVFENYYGNSVTVETSLLFNAYNEILTISHVGLTEENLNGAEILMQLTDDTFTDESLSPSNFTLFNAPQGISINQINYLNNTLANLMLAFDGTDFQSDIFDFHIEVNQAELYSIENLQSNNLTISEGVGIFDNQDNWGLDIFASVSSVFVTIENLPKNWETASITIFDARGARVHHSELKYLKVNKVNLNVHTGNYLVLVKINGIEFVNKVFVLPE